MPATSEDLNVLAFQHFYLLPIEAKSHPDFADHVAPRILGFFFLCAMAVGACYTVYFIGK